MVEDIIINALKEDIGDGDHSSLACVPEAAKGKAKLIIKDEGILAGVELAEKIFNHYDPSLKVNVLIKDGASVKVGEIALEVEGSSRSILATERLVLNFMQRMSGIATQTNKIVIIAFSILISVLIYYINHFFGIIGRNETIPLLVSIWIPLFLLFIISTIGLVKINEK